MTPNDFEHFRQLGENVGIEFKQIGNADELGSGTRNLFRYVRLYSGAVPVLDEEDQFKVTIPLDESYNPESVPQTASETARETTRETARETTRETTKLSLDENAQGILHALESAPSTTIRELAKRLGITAKGVEWHLKRLKSAGLLVREGGRARGVWKVLATSPGKEGRP